MAGRGPLPKPPSERRNRIVKVRGEMVAASGTGWQHPPFPVCPEGLKPASEEAWRTWFAAWFAARWTPSDLPGLRTLILTYDQVERGEFQRGPELRMLMDTYGITPKGQQDRRWLAPKVDDAPKSETPTSTDPRFARLRSVG